MRRTSVEARLCGVSLSRRTQSDHGKHPDLDKDVAAADAQLALAAFTEDLL